MNGANSREPLHIKKYSNRRYYDASRSRHVTLQEVYELVREDHDVVITDSQNGDDITNLVLLQILLEKDIPKLDVFPSSILHMMIRSSHQVLRTSVERFFGPFMSMLVGTQKQFDAYLRQALGGQFASPLDWAGHMMQALHPAGNSAPRSETTSSEPSDDESEPEDSLEALRQQVEALTHRIGEMEIGRGNEGAHGRPE